MKPSSSLQKRWNNHWVDEHTALNGPRKQTASRSWWLEAKTRAEFYQLAQRETPRMSSAVTASYVSQMIVGGRV